MRVTRTVNYIRSGCGWKFSVDGALNIKNWSVWHDVVYGWHTGLDLGHHWWFIAFGISLNSCFWALVCCWLFCFLLLCFCLLFLSITESIKANVLALFFLFIHTRETLKLLYSHVLLWNFRPWNIEAAVLQRVYPPFQQSFIGSNHLES